MIFVRPLLSLVTILAIATQSRAVTGEQVSSRGTTKADQSQSSLKTSNLLRSPSPEDYQDLYNFACGLSGNGSKSPVSRDELIKHYSNSGNERLKQVVQRYRIHKECRREPTAWRYHYIDEDGLVSINERSIDQRAANVLYFVRAVKPFSMDMFTYNWEDPELDRANMDRVTGPKFDDDLCGRQLSQMVDLADEMRAISQSLRDNSSRLGSASDHKFSDQHISLAKILDSYGRHESGRLMGKIVHPGSYHQCRWNKLILNEDTAVNMRYCWAHLSYERHLSDSLRLRERSVFELPSNVLYSGVCLPESCHSKSFARHRGLLQQLINTQFDQPSEYVDEHMEVTSLFCLVDEESDFRIPLVGKCLLASICCWCLTTILVTIYNHKMGFSSGWQEERQLAKRTNSRRKPEVEHPILRSVDLYESWQDFQDYYSRPTRKRAVQLDAMNFFKVFGCCFVVVGHTMALFAGISMDEVRTERYIETSAVLCVVVAGTLVVDTFFVISGILWAYFALKRLNKPDLKPRRPKNVNGTQLQSNMVREQPALIMDKVDGLKDKQEDEGFMISVPSTESEAQANDAEVRVVESESWPETIKNFCGLWLVLSLSRYLRIVPLFVLVHWFKKYVFAYLGEGPFWDYGLNHLTMTGACHKESPLTPFTFMSAYYPIAKQCTLQSWSISNDLFFALLAPPAILLIDKRPKVAAWLTAIACSMSYYFAMDQLLSYPSHLDEELRELRTFGFYRILDAVSLLYTAPHLRIFCFLAGVWGGYALYWKQEKLERRLARRELQKNLESGETGQGGVSVELPGRARGRQIDHKEADNELIEWPAWMRFATFPSLIYLFLILSCFGFNQRTKSALGDYHRLIYPQFATGFRLIWALANVTLFLRMITDWKDTLLMRWSASKFWQACTKLCLPILLIHLDILLFTINSQPSLPVSFTKWTFFNLGAGILMLCIPVAVILHVVYEMPLDKLIRSRYIVL